ncbi:ATP-binding protein [Thermohalobacter berrensis]|uniref:Histidine kinase/HSP90-like ATPase domain-containing protein n=1 Tax=Thermohalobacter berrensis TaxID=99594 RepID=A0A419T1N1_9FIRM|nr:ATP-binding protein [Thermohalobacter berrensis]RKD31362.1 hypothetical protein BET03_12785 [Thermohalobacter berrensis]
MDKKDSLKISIPKKAEYVSIARLTASSVGSKMGFNIEEIDDIKVAIAEACINLIQTSPKENNDNYEIEFNIYKDKLIIIVKDKKGTFTNEEIQKDDLKNQESKLGLFIIDALMDDVEFINYKDIGREIRMTKRIEVVRDGDAV